MSMVHGGTSATGRVRPARVALHAFLITTAVVWMIPIIGAIYVAFRPYGETSKNGIFTWPKKLMMSNFTGAFKQGEMARHFWVTMLIVVPALVLTLMLASFMAFAVSRYSFKFNLALLVLFTAGNLMPQQVLIQPLFQMYRRIPLPAFLSPNSGHMNNSIFGVIIIHVAFQVGFCTFVLTNYMKTIPKELGEAASVDGASVFKQFYRVIMPICKPALAALGTLEFTCIFAPLFYYQLLLWTFLKN